MELSTTGCGTTFKTPSAKTSRLRFTYTDDLVLLREFLAHNPMGNQDKWAIIQKNVELTVQKSFSIRTLKYHLQLLLELWLKKEKIDKKRSGVEEPYSEKDILLQEISTLCSESDFQVKRKRPLSKEQHLSELGKKARESHAVRFYEESNDIITEIITEEFSPQKDIEIHEIDDSKKHKPEDEHNYFASEEIQIINEVAIDSEVCEENTKENTSWVQLPATEPATSIKKHDQPRVRPLGEVFQGNIQRETPKKGTILTPTGKRTYKREPMRKNALSYLSEKGQRENELRKRELDLEERKLSLEERRLTLQEKKYEIEQKRMEMEGKERLHRIELERERAEAELKQKKVTSQLLESQQQLISKLLSK